MVNGQQKALENDDSTLKADLEKYCQMALNKGADDARALPISKITQSIRVRMGDTFPRALKSGTSYFAPPNWHIPWKYTKAMLASYRYVIVARIPYKLENLNDFTGPTSMGELIRSIPPHKKIWPPEVVEYWENVQKRRGGQRPHTQENIGEAIELEARKDGHQFAFCGYSGSCVAICGARFGFLCMALRTGGICRQPGRSRPCGTSTNMGMDFRGIYANLRWKNWLQGWSIFPEDYPPGPIVPPPYRTALVYID